MSPRGRFITLEGIDGVGKSTQGRLLAARLRWHGRSVLETREPGGAPGAEAIRKLVVDGDPERWSPETELLLFTAARRDHLEKRILPALAAGEIVICDRFVDSTRAYQGRDREMRAKIDELHRMMIGLDPDLTLVFDLDPERALSRASERDTAAEGRFEAKGLAFQQALRSAYRAIAEAEPERVLLIDADGTEDAVAARVWAAVAPRVVGE